MSIISDIEKLITEHGSAAILREKVGLLEVHRSAAALERDKAVAEIASLQAKIKGLEIDNGNLKADLKNATDEIDRLRASTGPPSIRVINQSPLPAVENLI